MYDVSSPKSLQSLAKWWNEFRDLAPVREGEEEDFCCIVVGNKIDVGNANGGVRGDQENASGNGNAKAAAKGKWKVTEEDAASFLELLIPRTPTIPPIPEHDAEDSEPVRPSLSVTQPSTLSYPSPDPELDANRTSSSPRSRTKSESQSLSIYIADNRHHTVPSSVSPPFRGRAPFPAPRHSRSRSATRMGYSIGTKNSLSSVATRESLYHTPASSFYESARSSPVPFPREGSSASPPLDRLGAWDNRGRGGRKTSTSSTNSSSAATITQSLFLRRSAPVASPSETISVQPPLPLPQRRPKLFFTSAKTGEGVAEVFEYVARRVVVRWEWERRQDDNEGWDNGDGADTIRIGMRGREGWAKRTARSCCTS